VCSFGSTSPASVSASGGTATMTFFTIGLSASIWHRRPKVLFALRLVC
jgi:hypothetical protein